MCEKPPFWRWFPRVLFNPIRKIPGLFIGFIMEPLLEIVVGALGMYTVALYSVLKYATTAIIRIDLALLIIPFFVVAMHGVYRNSDC